MEGGMTYSTEQAACLSGVTPHQLRYWKETGLIKPVKVSSHLNTPRSDEYDFRNLVELRTIRSMLQEGISLQKVRKTLEYLRESSDYSRPLAECKLITDGSTIFEICDNPSHILDTLRKGQIALCIALDSIVEELSIRLTDLGHEREDFLKQLLA
jgi:DNA-binding transcriptional MerR regulator